MGGGMDGGWKCGNGLRLVLMEGEKAVVYR